jgi:hypothetical protein
VSGASRLHVSYVPGGHPKLPHLWPGQNPPPGSGGTRDDYALRALLARRSADSFKRQLLREENFIGASTATWLRDVAKALNRPFDPDNRDRALVMLAKCRCNPDDWKPLLLWHITRDEFLLRDFLQKWLYPAYESGVFRVRPEELHGYLRGIRWRGGMTARTGSTLGAHPRSPDSLVKYSEIENLILWLPLASFLDGSPRILDPLIPGSRRIDTRVTVILRRGRKDQSRLLHSFQKGRGVAEPELETAAPIRRSNGHVQHHGLKIGDARVLRRRERSGRVRFFSETWDCSRQPRISCSHFRASRLACGRCRHCRQIRARSPLPPNASFGRMRAHRVPNRPIAIFSRAMQRANGQGSRARPRWATLP